MRRSLPAENPLEGTGDGVLAAPLPGVRAGGFGPPCPVDRMPRRRRNQLCIGVIVLGLANYVFYTLGYAALGGDAPNGHRGLVTRDDGAQEVGYFVRGHFIHSLSGHECEVSRGAWVYSYLHSISVPLTSGAMIISMLVLARPHILATMRGGWVSGQTFVAALGTIVILVTCSAAFMFAWNFVVELRRT